MRFFFSSLLLLGLCLSLVSCLDHRGFLPANPQQVRLKRQYSQFATAGTSANTPDLTEFIYDRQGRLNGFNQFSQSKLVTSSTMSYDSQGRLAQETQDRSPLGEPAVIFTYHYDTKGRIDSVFQNRDGVTAIAYDSLNRIIGRTSYAYNTTGRLSFSGQDTYELDERGNIITRLQLFGLSRSLRRQDKYTYDRMPNPFYSVPSLLYQSGFGDPAYNSPNNIVSSTRAEVNSLTGPFPSATQTSQVTLDFQDGLVTKRSNTNVGMFSIFRFEYEKY